MATKKRNVFSWDEQEEQDYLEYIKTDKSLDFEKMRLKFNEKNRIIKKRGTRSLMYHFKKLIIQDFGEDFEKNKKKVCEKFGITIEKIDEFIEKINNDIKESESKNDNPKKEKKINIETEEKNNTSSILKDILKEIIEIKQDISLVKKENKKNTAKFNKILREIKKTAK